MAFKTVFLCGLIAVLLAIGLFISGSDFSKSRTCENVLVKRIAFKHALGGSLKAFKGKGDWLFLGNADHDSIAKLKFAIVPAESEIKSVVGVFNDVANAALRWGSRVVLIVGPDKPSVYPEFLPSEIVPSRRRYVDIFLERLNSVTNLTIYNPTLDLLRHKKTNEFLYWATDTHWNNRGAFVAFSGFLDSVGFQKPEVLFKRGNPHFGDLLKLLGRSDIKLHDGDSWDVVWKDSPKLVETVIDKGPDNFGSVSVVVNERSIVDKHIWVVGDSFSMSLRQYLNATFREVHYLGHWDVKLKEIPSDLERALKKPDLIIVVRVERSF